MKPYLLIENGKNPDDPHNAALGFWLPPNTPFGNFQLKYLKITLRLDEANRNLINSQLYWDKCQKSAISTTSFERHIFANETFIYMLRKAADELISLIFCLTEYEKKKSYPKKIKIDCLGGAINNPEFANHQAFSANLEVLNSLNDISNAYKHSFINSDITIIGEAEPRIHALALPHNTLNSQAKFYDISLKELVKQYNQFYKNTKIWLQAFSKRNLPLPSKT